MKANELMIGDWVYDKMLKGYGKIEVITPFVIQCDIHTDTHNMDFFEPIPLTEEILKANGFVHHEYWNKGCYAYDAHKQEILWSMDFYIYNGRKEFGASGKKATINDWHCEFVHELQHALRLCGLNDLADNFKLS